MHWLQEIIFFFNLGMYGDLKLHGKTHSDTWLKLSTDSQAGSNRLKLSKAVDWEVGMDIVITSTSKDHEQLERHVIADIQDGGSTLITRDNLRFLHICQFEELDSGDIYSQCAEVGLLTRNIKISGEPSKDCYGGRLVIGLHVIFHENVYHTYRGMQSTVLSIRGTQNRVLEDFNWLHLSI